MTFRVAMLMFETPNFGGGVIQYVEDLYLGFKEAGYDVSFFYAVNENYLRHNPVGTGIKMSCGLRIKAHGERASIYAKQSVVRAYGVIPEALKEELETFDGLIVCSVPFVRTTGDTMWVEAIDVKIPKVCIAHDSEYLRNYPWMLLGRFDAYAGVHPRTMFNMMNFPTYVCCILNPFDISHAKYEPDKHPNFICNTSMYRSLKHNEDGVRMAPFLAPLKMFSAGGGIELSYLKSEKKCKQNYYWRAGDPDVKTKWIGKRIWKVAMKSGCFEHVGLLSGKAPMDALLAVCVGHVDFSSHIRGEHFNRGTVEAIIHHCVPFGRPREFADNDEGRGIVFGPENVVMLPMDAGPKRMAEIIKGTLADKSLCKEIVQRNLEKLKLFDRKSVAHQFIKLLRGDMSAGILGVHHGSPDKRMVRALENLEIPPRFPRFRRFPR